MISFAICSCKEKFAPRDQLNCMSGQGVKEPEFLFSRFCSTPCYLSLPLLLSPLCNWWTCWLFSLETPPSLVARRERDPDLMAFAWFHPELLILMRTTYKNTQIWHGLCHIIRLTSVTLLLKLNIPIDLFFVNREEFSWQELHGWVPSFLFCGS